MIKARNSAENESVKSLLCTCRWWCNMPESRSHSRRVGLPHNKCHGMSEVLFQLWQSGGDRSGMCRNEPSNLQKQQLAVLHLAYWFQIVARTKWNFASFPQLKSLLKRRDSVMTKFYFNPLTLTISLDPRLKLGKIWVNDKIE